MNTLLSHHAHRPIGHPDILDAIMDVCEESKSYGVISLLAAISKHHHSAVQPRLRRIRKRIVLNLDDFHWRDKENDKNMEYVDDIPYQTLEPDRVPSPCRIIECTRMTSMPIVLSTSHPEIVKDQLATIQQQLQPTTIFYRGRLHESVLQICRHMFPTVNLVICRADARQDLESVAHALPSGTMTSWLLRQSNTYRFVNFLLGQYSESQEAASRPVQSFSLRYRQRHYLLPESLRPTFRRDFVFRGIACQGRVNLEQEICHWDSRVNHKIISRQSVSQPCVLLEFGKCTESDLDGIKQMSIIPNTDGKFQTIHLDCYAEFSGHDQEAFFYESEDTLPSAYTAMFRGIGDASLEYLKDGRSRFTFRLFVLGHGDKEQDRADMFPIYSVTCGMQGTDPATPRTMVYQRSIDEDFAKCRINAGCKRCRSAEEE